MEDEEAQEGTRLKPSGRKRVRNGSKMHQHLGQLIRMDPGRQKIRDFRKRFYERENNSPDVEKEDFTKSKNEQNKGTWRKFSDLENSNFDGSPERDRNLTWRASDSGRRVHDLVSVKGHADDARAERTENEEVGATYSRQRGANCGAPGTQEIAPIIGKQGPRTGMEDKQSAMAVEALWNQEVGTTMRMRPV